MRDFGVGYPAARWRAPIGCGRIYRGLALGLIAEARAMYVNEPLGFELSHTAYALDATTIDLCPSLFPWAPSMRSKAAVRLHTLLDLRGNIPAFIRISNGKMHEVRGLDELPIERSCVARLSGAPAHPDYGSQALCVEPEQAQCRRTHQRATLSGMLRLPSHQGTNPGRTELPGSPERERGDGGWYREQAWWFVVPKPLAPAWVFLMGSTKRARRYPCPRSHLK